MAIRERNTIKEWFKTGKYPTQEQFWDWIDSYIHKYDKLDISNIDGLTEMLNDMWQDMQEWVLGKLENYYTKEEIHTKLEDLEEEIKDWTLEELENYYTKKETDGKLSALEASLKTWTDDKLKNYYTKAETDNKLDKKADKAYVDGELSKTNEEVAKKADKTYVDTELAKKANINHTHSYAGGVADAAKFLTPDNRIDYTSQGVTCFQQAGPAGNDAKVNDCPSSGWWHILRFTHNNPAGFYTDLAVPFDEPSLHYKRIHFGAVTNGGWVKILDALNYKTYCTPANIGAAPASHTHNYLPLTGGTCTGNVTAPAFIKSSDRRMKHGIKSIEGTSKDIDLIEYRLNGTEEVQYGVIAQDVEKVLPNVIHTDDNGYLSVDYISMYAVMIKDLRNEMIELKKEILTLKNK